MIILVEAVSFAYPSGVRALNNISLTVEAGEALAIVGENGAGKTTLARHLNGLLRPQSGEIYIGDWSTACRTVAKLSARVGYVFQNPDDQLFARTVGEEVAFGPRNLGWTAEQVRAAVSSALEQVGLSQLADRHPYDLSASERKFVALAATLAMHTPIVILDEPTTGLDAAGVSRMSEIVIALRREGVTLLTISHDLDFCAEHSERVIVMSQGSLVADGPLSEIFRQTEVLLQAQLRAPQLIRLAHSLGMAAGPTSVDAFVDAYAQYRRRNA